MDHPYFIAAAYGITALALVLLVAWVVFDRRARRAELAALEAGGLSRRSER